MNEWVIVGIVAVVVIFGAAKLPQIARNMGKAQSEFKKGLKEASTAEDEGPPAAPPAAAPPAAEPTPPASSPPPAERPGPIENPPA